MWYVNMCDSYFRPAPAHFLSHQMHPGGLGWVLKHLRCVKQLEVRLGEFRPWYVDNVSKLPVVNNWLARWGMLHENYAATRPPRVESIKAQNFATIGTVSHDLWDQLWSTAGRSVFQSWRSVSSVPGAWGIQMWCLEQAQSHKPHFSQMCTVSP